MDPKDIMVFKQIMQKIRENERVLECKIPKKGDWQTIFTLRSIIMSEPDFSCFRALPTNGDAREYAVDNGVVDILLKMQPEYQSYVPPPVLKECPRHDTHTRFPIALCCNAIEEWLKSNSSVVIIYGAPDSGKSHQIVHYILNYCNISSQNCRAICVLQTGVEVLSTAWRISDDRHETMGSTVGYKMCTNSRVSDCTNVAFCTDEVMLRSLLSNANQQSFVELTHLVVGNVGRRTANTDFFLSLLKEKHRLHPTLKLIFLTESMDVDNLASFFNRSKLIMVPEVKASEIGSDSLMPFGVEYIFLDSILTYISTRKEVLEIKRNMGTCQPLKVMAEMQERYGDMNRSYYFSHHMDPLLERCFYARDPSGFNTILKVLENHKHLVDYQHTEIKLTPLMIAAAKGFAGVVQTLLKLGANPCLRGKKGITALDWCDESNPNSCRQLLVDACQSHSKGGSLADSQGRLYGQLYHRIHNPYVVDHSLVLEIVMYIIAKRKAGKILVMLPDFTDVLQSYAILRESAHANTKRIDFMVCHRYVTEEEIKMTRQFPSYPHFLVILMGGPLLDMLPSLSSIDFLIDTGLRVERVYNPAKEAYLNRVCYNTKHSVSLMKLLPKQGCFFLYLADQLDSMPANEKPNRNGSGLPMQVLQALLTRDRSFPSVEMFFDSALTPPARTNVRRSIEILTQMGAIEQPLRMPTNLGLMLAHLNIELHLGKALLYSFLFKCLDPVLTIVASLHVGNPFKEPVHEECMVNMAITKAASSQRSYSDCLVLLRMYQQWGACKMNQKDQDMVNKYRLKEGVMDAIANMRMELMTVLRSLGLVKCGRLHNTDELNEHSEHWTRVKACLTAGFYPNLAKFDYGKRTFSDFCCTDTPLKLHPLSVVNIEELPTEWVIYDHKEDFMLQLLDHSSDDSPVHMVENTAISDCMVMLLCGIDEANQANSTATEEAESTNSGPYLLPFVPKIDESGNADKCKELLIGKRYTFQLSSDCYNAVVWLRQQVGRLFREFTANPLDTLARTDVKRILPHVFNILQEEEKNVCRTDLGGIGVRPKIKNRCPMGVHWNQRLTQTPSILCKESSQFEAGHP
uniref:Helicase-associated domain-containing protein n=1 Tax=Anopheles atroparvus TaxID=41427 RepID=A0A182IYR8_ANOAO